MCYKKTVELLKAFFEIELVKYSANSLKNCCISNILYEFYVSLTVHLGVILVNNQHDALYSMYLLLHLCTYFEHLVLIIRGVKFY